MKCVNKFTTTSSTSESKKIKRKQNIAKRNQHEVKRKWQRFMTFDSNFYCNVIYMSTRDDQRHTHNSFPTHCLELIGSPHIRVLDVMSTWCSTVKIPLDKQVSDSKRIKSPRRILIDRVHVSNSSKSSINSSIIKDVIRMVRNISSAMP